ncbi:MAG: outer membrane protein W [Crocinitomicaceae bacterium]|jgi:outer membrane protein W
MKRLAILAGALAITGSAMAQRPVDTNPFSLEGGLSINSLNNTFTAPTIKFRYFAAENIAIRLGITYGSTNDLTNVYGFNGTGGETADSTGTVVDKTSQMMIAIGGSYHFSQLEKLDPYVALDFMIGSGGSSSESIDTDGVSYVNGLSSNSSSKSSGIGVGVAAGFDYYFAENVFIGAEMGMAFSNWSDKGGEASSTFGGVTTSSTTLSSGKSSMFGNSATAAIRLGWRF